MSMFLFIIRFIYSLTNFPTTILFAAQNKSTKLSTRDTHPKNFSRKCCRINNRSHWKLTWKTSTEPSNSQVVYRSIWKWGDMPPSNIYMVSLNTSTDCQHKHSTLHKRKGPGYFRLFSTSNKSLKPWKYLGFFRLFGIYNIIPHPFLTSQKAINCKGYI